MEKKLITTKVVILCLLLVGFNQHSFGQLQIEMGESVQSYQNTFTSQTTASKHISQEQSFMMRPIFYVDTIATSSPKLLWQPFDGLTIVKQLGLGSLYGVLGGSTGLLLGWAAGPKGLGSITTSVIGGIIGFETGVVIGVMSAGSSEGGNGTLGGTLWGVPAGAALGLVFLSSWGSSGFTMSQYIMAALGATLGPVIAYHIFATSVYETNSAMSGVSLTLTPVFDHGNRGIQVAITF